MSTYGHCTDCGSLMESCGCPNCDYEKVEPILNDIADRPEIYEINSNQPEGL